MKNVIYIFLVITFISFSCEDFLEEEPKSSLTREQFFQTEQDFRSALTAVYGELQGLESNLVRFTSLNSDETTPGIFGRNSGDNFLFDNNEYTSSNIAFQSWWQDLYDGINQANGLIAEGRDISLPSADVALVNRYVAEAKFLRALYYFYLVISYGDVPLITEPTTSLQNLEIGRNPASEVYQQIIQDLQEAEPVLDPFYEGDDLGRATSGAAASLLAKVYLFQEDFPNARDKALQVMNSGEYDLFEDYLSVTRNTDKNGIEHIFSIQFARGFAENDANRHFGANSDAGVNTDIPDEITGQSIYAVEEQFVLDFPEGYRKDVTILDRVVPDGEGGTIDIEFYHCSKYFDATGSEGSRGDNNFNILRLADIMLIFAEAENEVNNGPSAEAYEAVNKIRRRAMNQDIDTPDPDVDLATGMSQEDFREAVWEERKWELAFEGHRRWDLIRTGQYLAAQPDATERNLLYPIPEGERDINENLEQNTGY
jgi:hypothetical protein